MFSPLPDLMTRHATGFVALVLLLLTSAAATGSLHAQERDLLFNQVNVSSQAAGITLEFEEGEPFSAELRNGTLLLNGSPSGSYQAGDALDRAWRALLAGAIAADNGGVARLLAGWSPPGDLSEDAEASALALESALRGALRPATPSGATGGAAQALNVADPAQAQSLLELLVRRPELAPGIASILDGADASSLDLHVGSALQVEAGDTLAASVLVVNADLRVDGRITGDAFVLGGDLRMGPEGEIGGEGRVLEGSLQGQASAIEGGFQDLTNPGAPAVPAAPAPPAPPLADEIRSEVERGIRDGLRASVRDGDRERRSSPGFFRNLVSGVGGLLQTVVSLLIFLGIGMGILYFFPRHFEVVSRTASNVPGRSFAVGWAALLLSPFLWIFGILFLTASLVGIPGLVVWIPGYWLALSAALLFGFLVMSRNLGSWWVNRDQAFHPQGIDPAQPAARLGVGLTLFLAAFAAASVLTIGGGVFTIFQVFLVVLGSLVTLNAAVMGMGAVLLSRAGRDRRWVSGLSDVELESDFGASPFEAGGEDAGHAGHAGHAGGDDASR